LNPIMADLGAAEGAVGGLYSIENTTFFVSILLAAGPLAAISRMRAALFGSALVVAGNLASAHAGSLEILMLTRAVTGVGAGLVSAAGTATAACSREPERIFAIVTVLHNLALSVQYKVLPYVLTPTDPTGGYVMMAVVALAVAPSYVWLLPPRPGAAKESTNFLGLLAAAPNRLLAVFVLLGLFLYETGQAGVFTFNDVIGDRSGLDEDARGTVLSVTGIIGLLGGVFAAWLGRRAGRLWPIIIGLGLNVAAAVALALCESGRLYVFLNLLWNVAYNFVVPYLMGVLAALDDRGRWAVAGDSLWNGGTAPGPWIAGLMVEAGGYLPLAAWTLGVGAICMLLVTGVLRRVESEPALAPVKRD
jgi:predicted MFS family arabinose efflux permease